MKKLIVITLAVVIVGALGVGAYAYYEGNYNTRGGWRMHDPQGSMMYGRGFRSRWNTTPDTCPCGAHVFGWNAPGEGTLQMIDEAKAKEVAEEYVKKYLPSYTVDTVEKDNWRPMYFVTIKGEYDVEQLLTIHGFSGQVMHVFPKAPATTEDAEE